MRTQRLEPTQATSPVSRSDFFNQNGMPISRYMVMRHRLLGRPVSESGRLRPRGAKPGTGDRRRMALLSTILVILVLRWRRTIYPGAPRVTGRTLHGGRLRGERLR